MAWQAGGRRTDRAESCRSVRGSNASSDGSLYGGGGGMAAATDVFLYALYFGNARTRERSAAPPASQPASQHRRPILIFSMQCRYPSLYMCSVRRGGEANGNPGVDYMHHARQPPECMPARTSTQDLCSSIGGVYLGFWFIGGGFFRARGVDVARRFSTGLFSAHTNTHTRARAAVV